VKGLPRQLALFLCFGLVATAVHVAIAAYLIGAHMMAPALGNGIAFVFANLFSYFAQSAYVFQQRPTTVQYGRFLCVSLVGLVLVAAISAGFEMLGVHYLAGIAAVIVILPFFTFAFHSLWTFHAGGERGWSLRKQLTKGNAWIA
jgi:putative flippase GtrA